MSKSALSRKKPSRLNFESLESRLVPTGFPISGSVFVDMNDNGLRETGENGIAGSTIELRFCTNHIDGHVSHSNECTPGELAALPVTTGTDGNFSFMVEAGDYVLVQPTTPTGYIDGKDRNGHNGDIIPARTGTGADMICLGYVNCDILGNSFGELPKPPTEEPPCTPPTETTGSQGLTPGFWKNNAIKHNGSAWEDTGYFQYQTVSSVFGNAFGALGSKTLVQALGTGGGGINALLRHSVAAVLNAGHPGVDYAQTTEQIISSVQSAIASGKKAIESLATQLDKFNNAGANLDQHGRY